MLVRFLGVFMFGLSILLLGCKTSAVDERARFFNEDGVRQFALGDYKGARESFEVAEALTPNDSSLLYNLGQCCDRTGDMPRAEQYYLTCLQRNPGHWDARQAIIALYYRTNRREEANRYIEDWLQREPNTPDVYVLDAWRLRQENALPQAHGRLQQALELQPQNRRANTELGILYELMGKPERSFVLYERVLQQDPQQKDVSDRLVSLKSKGVRRPLPD